MALSARGRKQIKPENFVFPDKAPGPGSYPIHNRQHAANALARAQGTSQYAAVKRKVCKRYPSLPACSR